eukprot:CAMPEP_0115749058 /NCGR_PEP_ID=MMETSP0272-20121206/93990_1 /TAXON_ID=71861 /ORGANISM="Scrippsiella trochoidea, Strain CCMP3099" /LENGTH=166 /DNA_ID=CAMNT_0003194085 /DNA_START=1 /DNA_END=497 /DNA_ORIENTATION=-
MRYPGEWKFAGGALDTGETPEEAARRELEEEFMVELPRDHSASRLHLLSIMQTRPVRNVSFIVHNFVAAAEENPWLEELDTDEVNAALARRRKEHSARVADGSFWALGKAEREAVAPEVREVRWLSMRDAVRNCVRSLTEHSGGLDPALELERARWLEDGMTQEEV